VPGFDIKIQERKELELDSSAITGNLRFILPTGRFQPYLKVGAGGYFATLKDLGRLGLKADTSGFTGRAGLGFDIYYTENVAAYIGIDEVFTTQDITNVHTYQQLGARAHVLGHVVGVGSHEVAVTEMNGLLVLWIVGGGGAQI